MEASGPLKRKTEDSELVMACLSGEDCAPAMPDNVLPMPGEAQQPKKKKYSCPWEGCDSSFAKKDHVAQHVVSVHEGRKDFPCPWEGCAKSFCKKGDLTKHVRGVHEKRKDFPCPWDGCMKSFSAKCDLKKHIKGVHEKSRDFPCSAKNCRKAFFSSQGLANHVASVHEKKRPVPCTWDGCTWTFQAKGHLAKHVSIVHEKKQPLACPVDGCGRTFGQRSKLTEHLAAHNGEQRYVCRHGCGEPFSTRGSRQLHEAKVHMTNREELEERCTPAVLRSICSGCLSTEIKNSSAGRIAGLCRACRGNKTATVLEATKVENLLVPLLGENIVAFSCDNFLIGGFSCDTIGRARPDLIYTNPWVTVIVEIDEHSHTSSSYLVDCEVSRYTKLSDGLAEERTPAGDKRPIVFLRFNPSCAPRYLEWNIGLLADDIKRFVAINAPGGLNKELGLEVRTDIAVCYVHYLFYGKGGQKHIDAARDAQKRGAPIVVVSVV